MFKRICFSLVLIVLLLIVATTAFAGLAALSYPDANNEQKTAAPSQRWINPTGEVSFYLTGGLERKVGYALLDGAGQTVAEGISDSIITAADQFTVLGQNYYGKVLTMPASLSEDEYTLKTRILDSQGNEVASEDIALTVDRTPPAAGELWWYTSQYTGSIMNNELVGNYESTYIKVLNVSDAVGIDRVQFESFYPDSGEIYNSVAAWYDAATGTAGIGTGVNNCIDSNYLPPIDGALGVRFMVYDKAGNKTVAQATVRYDGINTPAPELVAVYNPNVTTEFISESGLVGYEAYTPGMTVYTNPVKLLFRLVRTNWSGDNPDYGLYAVGGTLVYTDARYIYYEFTPPYSSSGPTLKNSSHIFRSAMEYVAYYVQYDLVLDATVPQSPVFVSWQCYRSDTGWSDLATGNLNQIFSTEAAITKIRVVVEPRNYDQIFVEPKSGSCTIPAGLTECTLDTNISATPGSIKWHSAACYVKSQDGSLKSTIKYDSFEWDLIPPAITSYTLDSGSKTVTILADEPYAGSNYTHVKLTSGWVMARNTVTGEEIKVNGAVTSLGGTTYQAIVSYASLSEGEWEFTLWVKDYYGNTASQSAETVVLDQTAPQIEVYRDTGQLADHGSLTSLSQVRITLSDNQDAAPEINGLRLEGGAEGGVVTLASSVLDGTYVLEYPVMFPSMGQEYNLVISAKDASGNVATRTVPFTYDPPQITLTSTGQETLNLPAIPANVVHPGGSNALSSGIITLDEAPLSGTYDLIVKSGSTATTTIVVQGLTLAPGEQKTIPAYDFAATGGRLDLPVRAEAAGQASLLVTSSAPNFPAITANLNFWSPEMQLTADPDWAVQPLIQTQEIKLGKSSGTLCRLTLDAEAAQAADPVDDPVCLVQWRGLPANYTQTASYAEGVLPPGGDYTPGYEIYLYNNGQRYLMAGGQGQALARLAVQDLAFTAAVTPAYASYYRKVQDVAVALQSSGSYTCAAIVATLAEAQEKGAGQVVCLVRWTTVPEGLAASSDSSNTTGLSGNFALAGDQEATWAVDLYSPYGALENAVTGSVTLPVVNPPLPELSFEAGIYGEKVSDSIYVTSELSGGEVGSLKFGTELLNTNMTLELDGTSDGKTSRQYSSANDITFSRTIKIGGVGIWESRQVTMKLYYTDLPEVAVEKQVTVMGVPSKQIKAVLTATNQTLDTTGVPVKLLVGIPAVNSTVVYDSARHGAWKARLGYVDLKNVFHALTDYQALTNGVLETTLTGFQIGFQKLRAQVDLVPPAGKDFYSRSIDSNMAYSTVLKGTAPEGQIYSRTLTGPAPLNTVMSLQVDSDTRRVMGSVVWQMSADNGVTWQNLETKAPYQITTKVNAGAYIVRAQMTNSLSGAMGYSEGVQLIAYKVPQLELSAPAAVIVGTPVTLKAQVTVDGQPTAEDVIIEWYNRTGEKLLTGASLEVTPADTASLLYTVQARMASAPESDRSAWVRGNLYVRVVPPRPPTGLIAVPTYMEYNLVSAQTYAATARLNLAAGLDPAMYPVRGEWHLPDGSVVEGAELNYSPKAADAEKRQALLEYVAWIEGFKEQTQATFRRAVTVGMYDWPEFRVDVKTASEVAPSLVTLTAAPASGYSGKLEKPKYSWRLPASAEIVRQQDNGRVMQVQFPEAGNYDVGVTVTDARGSTGEALGNVFLAEAAPFVVEFAPLFSNALLRELLNVTLRARVTGGHPQDRLVDYLFSIDPPGAEVTSFTGSGIIKGLPAGDYLAHLQATSKLGKLVEADYPLSVIANQPPTCQVTTWEAGDYKWWKAVCSDTDGRVAGYRWYQDYKLISSGQAIRVKKSELTGTLRFEAIDDAQGTYSENLVGSAG